MTNPKTPSPLADSLKAAIASVKAEREDDATLRMRLGRDLVDALAVLYSTLRECNKWVAHNLVLEPLTQQKGGRLDAWDRQATGDDAATGAEIRFTVAVQRLPSKTTEEYRRVLLSLRWSAASIGVRDREVNGGLLMRTVDDLPAGWCCGDNAAGSRYPTATAAIEAALARPEVARRVAEMLVELGA